MHRQLFIRLFLSLGILKRFCVDVYFQCYLVKIPVVAEVEIV